MTDIVERLRACPGVMSHDPECNCAEAAAEIERLNGVVDSWVDINNAAGVTLRAQEAEIERLTAHMRALADTSIARDVAGIFKGLWQGSEKECDELRAEIDRLRATINDQAAAIVAADRLVLKCEQHLADAKQEIAKLRADLTEAGVLR